MGQSHLSDYLPNDLILLSNELSSPLAFLCPNDPEWASKATTNWNEFRAEWITYRVHRQAIEKPLQINVSSHYVVCPYHKHFQFGDHRFGWPAR